MPFGVGQRIPREPPIIVVELPDGRFHLEGRDWFFVYRPSAGHQADRMAAKIEALRRKWVMKSLEWVAERCE